MIIIAITNNVTIFENEEEVQRVVYSHGKRGVVSVIYKDGTYKQVRKVESVRYVNNAQPCDYKVESSELASLKKELEIEKMKSWAFTSGYHKLLFDIHQNTGEYPQSVNKIHEKVTKDLESIKEQFNLKTL